MQEWESTYAFITYFVITVTICFSQRLKQRAGINVPPPPSFCSQFHRRHHPPVLLYATISLRTSPEHFWKKGTNEGQRNIIYRIMTIMIIYEMEINTAVTLSMCSRDDINASVGLSLALCNGSANKIFYEQNLCLAPLKACLHHFWIFFFFSLQLQSSSCLSPPNTLVKMIMMMSDRDFYILPQLASYRRSPSAFAIGRRLDTCLSFSSPSICTLHTPTPSSADTHSHACCHQCRSQARSPSLCYFSTFFWLNPITRITPPPWSKWQKQWLNKLLKWLNQESTFPK